MLYIVEIIKTVFSVIIMLGYAIIIPHVGI